MNVKRLIADAIIPTKAYPLDAGFDLYSPADFFLRPFIPTLIDTGIALEIPEGNYGLICDRSSMGLKGIRVLGGVVDSTFRNSIGVILINLTNKHNFYTIMKGNKIAQIIIQPYTQINELVEVNELGLTERNTAGLGSSGI